MTPRQSPPQPSGVDEAASPPSAMGAGVERTILIKPLYPTLSKAGRRLVLVSVPWFFVLLFGLGQLGLVGRDSSVAFRWFAVLLALGPIGVLVLHAWLGRVPGLRWIHHRVQPRLAIGSLGIDLRLPEFGERHFSWDDIAGLRPRPDRGADLLGADGVPLARLPESMILAGGNVWHRESIASVIVGARPDRYRLSGSNWAGVPNAFAIRTRDELTSAVDPYARRRRLVNVGIGIASVVVTAIIVLRYISS